MFAPWLGMLATWVASADSVRDLSCGCHPPLPGIALEQPARGRDFAVEIDQEILHSDRILDLTSKTRGIKLKGNLKVLERLRYHDAKGPAVLGRRWSSWIPRAARRASQAPGASLGSTSPRRIYASTSPFPRGACGCGVGGGHHYTVCRSGSRHQGASQGAGRHQGDVRQIQSSTVHRSPGTGAGCVQILDTVDAEPMKPGVLLSERGAVTYQHAAISRARGKLIVVADVAYFEERAAGSVVTRMVMRALAVGHREILRP